jgi:hypothetical protein
MKSIFKITALLVLIQLWSCGGDDNEKSEREMQVDVIAATPWGHAQVTHNPDGDLSDQYTNFMMVFTGEASDSFDGTYIISNGGFAFSENAGKWKFNDTLDKIILDSGKEMDIQLDETHLQLDFVTPPGGKVVGLSGHFVFDLQPL